MELQACFAVKGL